MHVVFGTGPIGLAVIDELLDRGEQVRAANRSGRAAVPPGVEIRAGDASDPVFATMASEDASVIYQCLNPPYNKWPELFPPLQRAVVDAAEATGARLVTLENLYMYAHDSASPMSEDTPERPHTRKGRVRKAMADELRQAHADGRVEMAIGRASSYFGPRGTAQSPLGERVVPKIIDGKNTSSLGDPSLDHSYSYLPDIATGLVTLGTHDEALGEVWHLPTAEATSTSELARLMYDAAGTTGEIRKAPRPVIRAMSWMNPILRELMEMLYEFDEPYVVDSSKFTKAFGLTATPLPEAAAATVEWFQQRG